MARLVMPPDSSTCWRSRITQAQQLKFSPRPNAESGSTRCTQRPSLVEGTKRHQIGLPSSQSGDRRQTHRALRRLRALWIRDAHDCLQRNRSQAGRHRCENRRRSLNPNSHWASCAPAADPPWPVSLAGSQRDRLLRLTTHVTLGGNTTRRPAPPSPSTSQLMRATAPYFDRFDGAPRLPHPASGAGR